MDRNTAFEILKKHVKEDFYIKHSLGVEAIMRKLAAKLEPNNIELWGIAGLLHDLFYYDWRTTKFDEGSHAYVHPRIACENALKLTELSDLEKTFKYDYKSSD